MKKTTLHDEIFLIEDFLSSDECNNYLNLLKNKEFEKAKVNIGGKQTMMKGVRNNERIMFKDENLAQELWQKLQPFVKPEFGIYKAYELNEMIRIYKYNKGQRFKMHRDGSFERNENETSLYTFMIYLNEDFEGGETTFRGIVNIKPKTGMALIFHHPLLHEGKEILQGTKYVLRTDVMYKKEFDEK